MSNQLKGLLFTVFLIFLVGLHLEGVDKNHGLELSIQTACASSGSVVCYSTADQCSWWGSFQIIGDVNLVVLVSIPRVEI